jgi:AcrR family transcriptional regulator
MTGKDAVGPAAVFPSTVAGDVRLDAEQATSPLGSLTSFASRLAWSAIAPRITETRKPREAGCHASLFREVAADGVLDAEAVALHQDEAGSSWHVVFRDPAGEVVATVSLSYVFAPRAVGARIGAELSAVTDEPSQKEVTAKAASAPGDQRREQIAAAAAEVIARKGFASATMREIADAAGMHVPTMYQYVASKDAMLELVYGHIMAQVRIDAAEAAAHFETAADRLRATIAALVDKGDRYRRGIGVLNRELKSLSPEARRRVLADYAKLIGQLADLIAEGVASGEFRPVNPVIAANFVEATCDIWPLRQFAVQRFGQAAFRTEVEELILGSLRSTDAAGRGRPSHL